MGSNAPRYEVDAEEDAKHKGEVRSRCWVFTINNYTEEQENRLQAWKSRYMVYGRETAPSTGTRHLQGYVCLANPAKLSAIRAKIGAGWYKPAKGTPAQNLKYCSKSGDFYGTPRM